MIEINTLNNGTYYIGDPLKLLPSSIYEGIWGSLYKYEPGLYSAFGYKFVIYETHYENTTIYKDNIDREYNIETNTICIAPKEIVIESIYDEIFSIDVLSKMIVYKKKKHLYINFDETMFHINIGEEELLDNESDNESTNSLEEYIKKYSIEEYTNEYSITHEDEDDFHTNIDDININ